MTSPRLKAGFKAFFDNVFQRLVLKVQVGKHLFETAVLVLKILDLFNVRGLHAAVSGLPVVVGASEIRASRQTSLTVRPASTD